MTFFRNIRIRTKLFIGFGICILFALILSLVGIFNLKTIKDDFIYLIHGPQDRVEHLMAIQTEFMTMRYRAANFAMNSGDADFINGTLLPQYETAYANFLENLDEYEKSNDADTTRSKDIIDANHTNAEKLRSMLAEYKVFSQATLQLSIANMPVEADLSLKDAIPISNNINALINEMIGPAIEYREKLTDSTEKTADNTGMLLIALTAGLSFVSLFIAYYISGLISKPVVKLRAMSGEIAKGNLDIILASNDRDEIGELTRELCVVKDTVSHLVAQLNKVEHDYESGDTDARLDLSNFQGSYYEVAEGINVMLNSIVNENAMFMECVTEFGNGNFNATIPMQPGKKVIMNQTIDGVRNNLKSVASDMETLVKDSIKGNLSARADTEKYRGGWASIMNDINHLLDAVIAPIQEASDVLQYVSAGNFDVLVEGDYKGDHQLIKTALNKTITNISSYIKEISEVLHALSANDLDQEIKREYVGKFTQIKDAINEIVTNFNRVISNIKSAADQVAAGARQISETSMSMANGATEQASSVEELNATVHVINENTVLNAKNAQEAETLSESSMKNATKGDTDMKNMLQSMEGIKVSSSSISNIIKVIDDIAFQTNLLALNAAVEAARAGEHGKGFTVVAEQVRSLAGRSQEAARNTAELIEDSINKVNEGQMIADQTATALKAIVNDITKVSAIITDISQSSNEQASAIRDVTDGLATITQVVQSNSAVSEESAASSQELSSQAEMLQNLVSVFKLKRI